MKPMSQTNEIDIVIPVAQKDLRKLKYCINGIKSHCLDKIRNIFVVCSKNIASEVAENKDVKVVDEAAFPFTKAQISSLISSALPIKRQFNNSGWYYQQLLKMYIFKIIPDLLENVLILDSDFFFRKQVSFFSNDPTPKILLANGYPLDWENNQNVQRSFVLAEFAKRLVPEWNTTNIYSGIHHHCIFNRSIINALHNEVENLHDKDFWLAFIDSLDLSEWNAAAEYVIYYHYVLKKFRHLAETNNLNSYDFILDESFNGDIETMIETISSVIDAVGFHSLVQLKKRFDPLKLINENDGKIQNEGIYCIHLTNGNVEIVPAQKERISKQRAG